VRNITLAGDPAELRGTPVATAAGRTGSNGLRFALGVLVVGHWLSFSPRPVEPGEITALMTVDIRPERDIGL
jgi:hypothetical protein